MKIRLTSDAEFVQEVKQAIKDKNGYCPCAIRKDEDHKCMCKTFREQEEGVCPCGLYEKTKT